MLTYLSPLLDKCIEKDEDFNLQTVLYFCISADFLNWQTTFVVKKDRKQSFIHFETFNTTCIAIIAMQ